MKTSTLDRNGVSSQTVELISRLVESIPWPARRRAMGDVTASLLEGKARVAERVFGWSRYAVKVGIHEARIDNVRRVNALADADEQTLRISIDTKATVHVGDYCRGGRSRGPVALKALDHDMCIKEKLVPGGILDARERPIVPVFWHPLQNQRLHL